jgi:glycosyltransferase involved in cell wall biosynthesis
LISAYACRPNTGSEPGIGWNFATHAAQSNDVWVLTRPDNRTNIEAAVNADQTGALSRIRFVYVPLTGLAAKAVPGKLVHVRYAMWQRQVAQAAQRLHDEVKFDVVHHVTYGCYWQPAGVAALPEVPMIWGPVGGGESAPKGLLSDLDLKGRVMERARDFVRWAGERRGSVRRSAARATLALATTRETAECMRAIGTRNVEVFTAMGLKGTEIDEFATVPAAPENGGALSVVSVGRLLDWKGFHLGLRAFAEAQLPAGSRYDVIGDGPAMAHLRREAEELGIADKVHFAGQLPRERAMELLAKSQVLVHPSLHDSGGWVCLEAMAMGRPVLCLDLHGPAMMISEETGVKVPASTPAQTVTGLATAMRRLAGDPAMRDRMGQAGRARARDAFSWTTKAREIAALYDRVIGDRPLASTGATGAPGPSRAPVGGTDRAEAESLTASATTAPRE